MESNKKIITDTTNEIDLSELFAKAVLTVKNNFILLTTTFFMGSMIGLAHYQFTPKIYESKMLISSDILTEEYGKSINDNLSRLIKEGNVQSLSEKIGLSVDQASEITGVEITSVVIEKPDTELELKEKDKKYQIYLNIGVKMKDNSIWPLVQTGLINCLQNNEFVNIQVEQKKKYLNQIIEKINLELADLEKLKAKMADGGLTQGNKESLILFNPTTVNSIILELNKEKINLQNSLELINSIHVVEGFTVFKKPVSPKLSLSIVGGASFGMLLAFIVIAIKTIKSTLKFAEEKLGSS